VQHWEKRLVRNWQYRSGRSWATLGLVLGEPLGSALGNWRSLGPALELHSEQCSGQHSVTHWALRWRLHPGPLGLVLGPALGDAEFSTRRHANARGCTREGS
jgi:hypothetical protein